MILVTGAAGKTGRAVMQALKVRNRPVRALVRDEEQSTVVRSLGAAEFVLADLLNPAEIAGAMEGVTAVYLIVPNVHPQEVWIGEIAMEAALEAGVERLVYHSVLYPQTREMPHHWNKLMVEEGLLRTGLEYTILQPAAYMQNILAQREEVISEGIYRVPYGEGAALSLVDLDDVADVAARVLVEDGHCRATYELAGPEAWTPAGIAQVLSEELGRPVEAGIVSVAEWRKEARAAGLGEYALDALCRMFAYYDRFGLRGNPATLEWLLGRRATSLDRFIGDKFLTA